MHRKSHNLTLHEINDNADINPKTRKNYLIEKWRREKSWHFFMENPQIMDVYLLLSDDVLEWIAARDEYSN